MKNIIILIATLFCIGLSSDLNAQSDIYINFDRIPGESQDNSHDHNNGQWSDVYSVSRSVEIDEDTGKAKQGGFNVQMARDKGWLKLMEKLKGNAILTVTVDHTKNIGAPESLIYLKTTLTNVYITSIDYGDDPGTIDVTFKAETIEEDYKAQNPQTGEETSTHTYMWDYKMNTEG